MIGRSTWTVGTGLVLALAVGLWWGGWLPSRAQGEASPVQRTLNVSGRGTVFAVPDALSAQLSVETEAKELSQALAENNARMNAVLARLEALGIAKEDVQTVDFFVSETRDREGNLTGFRVVNNVRVTVRQLDQAGAVLDEVLRAGANRISGIQLTISDPTPLVRQARDAAVADAQAKAQQLAQAAGMTLGKPLTISESDVGAAPPSARAAALSLSEAAVPLAEGQLSVSVTVSLTFEMR